MKLRYYTFKILHSQAVFLPKEEPMIKRLSGFIILCLLSTTALSQPVWIDTDLAHDDWLALTYLVQQPQISIKAITVAGDGVNDCAHGLPQLKYFLQKMHRTDIPIACGAKKPLEGGFRFPAAWRESAFQFYGIQSLAPDYSVRSNAVKLIYRVLEQTEGHFLLISLAPMTNIAEFYQEYPALFKEKIEGIYFTGGAFRARIPISDQIPQSHNTVSAWNNFIDPKAVAIVLRTKPHFFAFVTENATQPLNDVVLAVAQTFKPEKQSDKSEFITRLLRYRGNDLFVADAITAWLAIYPKYCHWHGDHVVVLLEPAAKRGETVFTCKGLAAIWCGKISQREFIYYYLQGLGNLTHRYNSIPH